ncbi:Oidioi.mRNA.OKI2018_I69.PAR.g8579.t1.cds [Oikopleura dioica]|uniref:Oidioi.mRNA.OKI2018_I69.PAR.g8579.t1.cds n=1 Tax=Oikopleura dioica TaxID=34765 RepID=A0ABN7RK40_OIKDI|nr:Oidioi.mRNA.OKI2018_I69.PAR.g8579.t1.cds [Oikopleura dioica]
MTFDREIQDRYNVEITACDGGKPQRCSSEKKTIKISDKNDNSPLLRSDSVRFSIPEDAKIGTVVGKILATDKDDPFLFGKLSYQLDVEEKQFGIDAESGEIFVKDELDYETKKEYNMTVLVTDGGGKSTKGLVKIQVQNVNDNRPVAVIPKYIALASDVQFGDVISTFEISDADGTEPVIQLGGRDAELFALRGHDLIFESNYSRDLDAEITLTVYDGQNTSVAMEYEITVSAAISAAIIGAVAAVAGIFILIVVFIFLQRRLRAAHNDKMNSSNFGDNSANSQNISRTDLIIDMKMKSERSGSEGTICTARGALQMNQKSNSRRADSDSGRGESGSETQSRNHLAMLGHYCNQDCLTLGHSDACWLPSNSSSKPFEVDVSDKINQVSSLYVWERTSDYSSHTTSSGNNSSGKQNRTRLPLLPTLHSPTNKPCLLEITLTNATLTQFSFEEKLTDNKDKLDEKIAELDEERNRNQNLTNLIERSLEENQKCAAEKDEKSEEIFRLEANIVEKQQNFESEISIRINEIGQEKDKTEALKRVVGDLLDENQNCTYEKSSIIETLELTTTKLKLEETKPDCVKMMKNALFVLAGTKGAVKYLLDDDGTKKDLQIQKPDSTHDRHYLYNSIAASIRDDTFKKCEEFDGSIVTTRPESLVVHKHSCLAIDGNRPVAVGGWTSSDDKSAHGTVESFNSVNWEKLPDIPKKLGFHTCVGVENGLLVLGGWRYGINHDIFLFRSLKWTVVGQTEEKQNHSSSIKIGNSIFLVNGDQEPKGIVRKLVWDGDKIESSKIVNEHTEIFYRPILFQVDQFYCL